ncbi:TPA: hypothetical protein I7185_20835 [Vibrio vulnificus]|nr:hypothetical protein [Vibrio vulnificus]
MKKVKLGFYAVKFGSVALCHGASLVVTHDKSTLRELAPVNKGQPASRQSIHFSSLHLLAALNLSFVIRQETIVLIRMSQWNNTKSHIENGKNH